MTHNTTSVPPLKTLSSLLNKALKDGYTENFKATESGRLKSMETDKKYTPEELQIVDFYRFEGASDPADNAILYMIESRDGAKGTLVDSYGAQADANVAKLVTQIPTIEKQKQ